MFVGGAATSNAIRTLLSHVEFHQHRFRFVFSESACGAGNAFAVIPNAFCMTFGLNEARLKAFMEAYRAWNKTDAVADLRAVGFEESAIDPDSSNEFAAMAADATQAIMMAVSTAQTDSAAANRSVTNILRQSHIEGLTGSVSFDARGDRVGASFVLLTSGTDGTVERILSATNVSDISWEGRWRNESFRRAAVQSGGSGVEMPVVVQPIASISAPPIVSTDNNITTAEKVTAAPSSALGEAGAAGLAGGLTAAAMIVVLVFVVVLLLRRQRRRSQAQGDVPLGPRPDGPEDGGASNAGGEARIGIEPPHRPISGAGSDGNDEEDNAIFFPNHRRQHEVQGVRVGKGANGEVFKFKYERRRDSADRTRRYHVVKCFSRPLDVKHRRNLKREYDLLAIRLVPMSCGTSRWKKNPPLGSSTPAKLHPSVFRENTGAGCIWSSQATSH